MTLGTPLKNIQPRRLAGAGGTSSWGKGQDIPAGQAIEKTELVRASIGGRPIAWSVLVVTVGGAGDNVLVLIESGVGGVAAKQTITKNATSAPLLFPGWPGAEISVSFHVDVPFVTAGSITAQVAPVNWPPSGAYDREGSFSP